MENRFSIPSPGVEMDSETRQRLDRTALATFGVGLRPNESESAFRERIEYLYLGPRASLDAMDFYATQGFQEAKPLGISNEMVKFELSRHWMRQERLWMSWWARCKWWWNLWLTI